MPRAHNLVEVSPPPPSQYIHVQGAGGVSTGIQGMQIAGAGTAVMSQPVIASNCLTLSNLFDAKQGRRPCSLSTIYPGLGVYQI